MTRRLSNSVAMNTPPQLPVIQFPVFTVARGDGVPITGDEVRLVLVSNRRIPPAEAGVTIELTFKLDGRLVTGELVPVGNKSDMEIEAEEVIVTEVYQPYWLSDTQLPFLDIHTFHVNHPTQMFPTWYLMLEEQLGAFINGALLGSRWRLESIQTNVPEHLGGISECAPVELSPMELGYLHHRRAQIDFWLTPTKLVIDTRA